MQQQLHLDVFLEPATLSAPTPTPCRPIQSVKVVISDTVTAVFVDDGEQPEVVLPRDQQIDMMGLCLEAETTLIDDLYARGEEDRINDDTEWVRRVVAI